MSENNRISCKIDLIAGTVEIIAPPEHFPQAAQEARELMSLRATAQGQAQSNSELPKDAQDPQAAAQAAQKPTNARSSRTAGGSSDRPGRLGSFSPVDLKMNEEQERELHSFYQQKSPKTGAEQVVVAMKKGEEILSRNSFNYNEIYTLMHLGGERDLPKALDVLIAALKKDNWLTGDGKAGFSLKFLGKDHVGRMAEIKT